MPPDPARREPALRIADGDTVVTDMVPGNTLRGFFHIEGAEPGDALAVRLEHLEPHAAGHCAAQLHPNALDQSARNQGLKYGHARWSVDQKTGMARLTQVVERGGDKKWTEMQSRLKGLELPVKPMIGTLATALDVEVGKAPSVMTSGRHGGNIDWNGAAEGVTMYFPVFVKGGLFGLDQRSAAILMGMCAKYEVGNIVDPAWTMVCKMPKPILRRFGTSPYDRKVPDAPAVRKP